MKAVARHSLDGSRRCEAPGATAARKPHEQGLRDIVLLVTEPHHARFATEKVHSRGPRLGLARSPAGRRPFAFPIFDPERIAHPPTEPRVRTGLPPAQPVIEMQDPEARPALGPMCPEQEEERQGIGPAGKRHAPVTPGRRGVSPSSHRRVQSLAWKDRCELRRRLTQSSDAPCRNTAPAPPAILRVHRPAGCSPAARPIPAARPDPTR